MIRRMLGIVFLGFILAVPVAAAQPAGGNDFNTGQDITRPLARLDARYPYQLLAKKRSKDIFTLRIDIKCVDRACRFKILDDLRIS